MLFAKYQKIAIDLSLALCISLGSTYVFATAPAGSTPSFAGSSGGTVSVNIDTSKLLNLPDSYGGAFPVGIGNAIEAVGIPVVDGAKLAEAQAQYIKDAIKNSESLAIMQTVLEYIKQQSESMRQTVENAAANLVARNNKASEDIYNTEVLEQMVSSPNACKDISVTLSLKEDIACEMIESMSDMYNSSKSSSSSSTLMAIAKGLNSDYADANSEYNLRVKRIIQRYNSDMKTGSPKNYYGMDRFISENVSTFDSDQVADLKDFLFIQIPPIEVTSQDARHIKVSGKSEDLKSSRHQVDKGIAADTFVAGLLEKVPSQTGVSPLDAMQQFVKSKNDDEYTELVSKSDTMTPTLLTREMVAIRAYQIHQSVKRYEHSLKEERVAARVLAGNLDRNFE